MSDIPFIQFSPLIQNKIHGLKLGVLLASNIIIKKKSDFVESSFTYLEKFIHSKFTDSPPSSDDVVSAVRRMYRRIGWEPTQYRPSSEAMIRRILKNKGLYRINNIVDLGNITSTLYHLPMGLYDRSKIIGQIFVDIGKTDETYEGISKVLIHADGKLILRDESTIFGNPTADSKRTSIQPGTEGALAIFFTPPEVEDEYLQQTLNHLENLYKQDGNAVKTNMHIIKNQ